MSLILICAAGRAAVRAFSSALVAADPQALCPRISPLSRAGPKTRGVRRAHPEPASPLHPRPADLLPTSVSASAFPEDAPEWEPRSRRLYMSYRPSNEPLSTRARALDARNLRRSPDPTDTLPTPCLAHRSSPRAAPRPLPVVGLDRFCIAVQKTFKVDFLILKS